MRDNSFSIILIITLLLIPFVLHYWKSYYSVDKPFKYLIIILVLMILIIMIKKIYIINKVSWSKNYHTETKVYQF